MSSTDKTISDRIPSIDAYRGIAIILMALGNYAAGVRWVPAGLKHADDIGYTVADVVAPMFILSIAATAGLSLRRRRQEYGTRQALGHLVLRSLALIGIGAIITAGDAITPSPDIILSWGVLQCIGTSCLLLAPLIFSPPWVRILTGLSLLAIYQWLLDSYFLDVVLKTSHNGLVGTLSWTGFLLVGTGVFDYFYTNRSLCKRILLLALFSLSGISLALLLASAFPISKNRASATYMLFSLGLCLAVFMFFYLFFNYRPDAMSIIRRIGRNPLGLYISHLLVLAVIISPGVDSWYEGAPIILTIVQCTFILAAIIGLSYFYEKKKLVLKL